jgi:tetratricopeptide (TPR) repeat protein
MTCAILAVLLHNLVDFAIFEPGVWMTFWVVMACLVAGNSEPRPDAPTVRQTSHVRRVGIIAAAVVLMAVYCLYVWRPVWSTTVKVQDAMLAASTGQFDRAHDALNAAFAADPLSSTPANFNGRLYLQQYEMARQKQPALLEKAAGCLRQAIDANPADYKNYEKLAQVYSQEQRWQDTYDWYLRAAERYPGCERLWFRLGQAAEQLGQPQAALGYYTKAVQIEEAYQQQFRRMYPTREKVISRLGEKELATARKRIEELSNKAGHE